MSDEMGQAPRRTPRQGAGASPVGSTLSVVLAVIAVVAGFLILRNITDDADASGVGSTPVPGDDADTGTDDDTDPGDGSVATVESSTTVPTPTTSPRVTDGATVVVANANSVPGSAGAMTKSLELATYTMTDPVNASGADLADTIVYYDATVAAAQDVADSVARDLGGVEVATVPSPPPTESGSLEGGASVLVLLGDNEAGRSLEELGAAPTDAAVTPPDPSDGAAETTTSAPGADASTTDADADADAETDDG